MSDLTQALQDEAEEREDATPLDAYMLVLCEETDDYPAPRGRVLGTGRAVAFAYHLGSYDCPAGARVGCVYFVPTIDRHGMVTHYPFALLPVRAQREVQRFRAREGRRYLGPPPWVNAEDLLEAWP